MLHHYETTPHSTNNEKDTLFVIWMGGNDYFTHGVPDVDKTTNDVIDAIEKVVRGFVCKGAKRFLFINLPDFSRTPADKIEKNVNLHEAVVAHNHKLEEMAERIKHEFPDTRIAFFDIFTLFNELLDNTAEFNQTYKTKFTVTDKAFWLGGYTKRVSMSDFYGLAKQYRENGPPGSVGSQIMNAASAFFNMSLFRSTYVGESMSYPPQPGNDPENYVFLDNCHVTYPVQHALGWAITEFTEECFDPGYRPPFRHSLWN
ncbi:MAG: hypothetical protein GY750_03205 [Lentisphaerae bacterium]|nr:hypothetical protein [Lentisphaerota bacterium]MCP4100426.1 hypothetical protein [Lentisphaerota bacterium]